MAGTVAVLRATHPPVRLPGRSVSIRRLSLLGQAERVARRSTRAPETKRRTDGRTQAKSGRRLLQTELDSDVEMHGGRLAIQSCRLILPLFYRVHRGLMQERRTGYDSCGRDLAIGIDGGVDNDRAADPLCSGELRIDRRSRGKQAGGPDLSANDNRSGRLLGFASERREVCRIAPGHAG